MTNREKLNAMSDEEFAEMLDSEPCPPTDRRKCRESYPLLKGFLLRVWREDD